MTAPDIDTSLKSIAANSAVADDEFKFENFIRSPTSSR